MEITIIIMGHVIYALLLTIAYILFCYWLDYRRLKNCDKLITAYEKQTEIKDKLAHNLTRIISNYEKIVKNNIRVKNEYHTQLLEAKTQYDEACKRYGYTGTNPYIEMIKQCIK